MTSQSKTEFDIKVVSSVFYNHYRLSKSTEKTRALLLTDFKKTFLGWKVTQVQEFKRYTRPFVFLFLFFFSVLGFQHRAWNLLDRSSTS
jgi:hypothetical protein